MAVSQIDEYTRERQLVSQKLEPLLPKYMDIIENIRITVETEWFADPKIKAKLQEMTPHDYRHNLGVICKLLELIPLEKQAEFLEQDPRKITEEEWFCLIAAAWLHDVGMIPVFDDDGDKSATEIRDEHHSRSKEYVLKHDFGFNHDFNVIIGELCLYHRQRENIRNCIAVSSSGIRVQLLAAYLRIADAIDVSAKRVDERLFQRLLASRIPLSSRMHWLKSFWIKDIILDHDNHRIIIDFKFNEKNLTSATLYLANRTKAENAGELESCKEVLAKGNISYFSEVEDRYSQNGSIFHEEYIEDFARLLKMELTSSASQLADMIIANVLAKTDPNRQTQTNGTGEFGVVNICRQLREYVEYIESDLHKPSHALVKMLDAKISKVIGDKRDKCQEQLKINELRDFFWQFKIRRKEALSQLKQYAIDYLTDQEVKSILLHGYSSIIIDVLRDMGNEFKQKSSIYVCESRNKTKYDITTKALKHMDGFQYVKDIAGCGYEEVKLIPDALASSLIRDKKIQIILFGANSIDTNGGRIVHTRGHLSIVNSASVYNTPVFVLVDSFKCDPKTDDPYEKENIHKDRSTWFDGILYEDKPEALRNLIYQESGIEFIEYHLLDGFITDHGFFPNYRFQDFLEKASKSKSEFFD